MNAAGIVAEFNPFHNGHKYLLEQVRSRGATHIAVVMSGNAVQRGSSAIFDKYFRADTAINNGADLVLELPAPFSCSNAEIFASSAIKIFASLGEGVISHIAFGSETDDCERICKAAEVCENLKDSDTVRRYLSNGKNYPSAMHQAVIEQYGNEIAEILENPNSILAIEYSSAVKKISPWMNLMSVKRISVGHNDNEIKDCYASASKIRSMILSGEDVTGLIPGQISDICIPERLDNIYAYHLNTSTKKKLLTLPDVDEKLADRIIKTAGLYPETLDDFLLECKSKNITMARLRRMSMHLILGITKKDLYDVPYARVLAFNKRGAEILSKGSHGLPVDTSLKRLEQASKNAQRTAYIENKASWFRHLGVFNSLKKEYKNDYRVSIRMKK